MKNEIISLNKKRRIFLKENAPKNRRLLKGLYFVMLCLYDGTAIAASLLLGILVEKLQNPTGGNYLWLIILAPLLFLLSSIMSFFSNRFSSRLAFDGFNSIKINLFKKVLNRPHLTNQVSSGNLLRAINDDSQSLGESYLFRSLLVLESILAFLAYFAIIAYFAHLLLLIYVVCMVLVIFLISLINKKVALLNKSVQDLDGQCDSELLLIVDGAKIIQRQGKVATNYMHDRYKKLLNAEYKVLFKLYLLQFTSTMLWIFFNLILPSILTFLGIILSSFELMTLSGAIMMLSLISYINVPVTKIQTQLLLIQRENKTFDRINSIFLGS